MIIANHCHIWPEKHSLDKSIKELVKDLKRYYIDGAVVYPPIPPFSNDISRYFPEGNQNKWITRIVEGYDMILIPWCTIDINNDPIAQIEEAHSLGCKGFKMHPQHQGFIPNSEKMFSIYEKISDLGLPILFHAGYHSPRPWDTLPRYFDDVSREFPKLKIIIEHMGMPFYDEAIVVAIHRKNVYLGLTRMIRIDGLFRLKIKEGGDIRLMILEDDGSEVFLPQSLYLHPKKLEDYIRTIGSDKFIWGLDWPYSRRPDVYIEVIDKLNISYIDKVRILGRNILRLSGM